MGGYIILTVDMRRLPRLFCFATGALLTLVVCVLTFEYRHSALTREYSENYGTALARMAAQQAVDAALNHDLVSLQVILQDVAANPRVVLASIHDVENRLLVQAGDAQRARRMSDQLITHTAPITLHDSIAGSVSVSLSRPERPLAAIALLTITASLLAALAGWSFYQHRDRLLVRRQTAPEPAAGQPTDQVQTRPDEEEQPLWQAQAVATVGVYNLASLEQQVSAEVFRNVMATFEHILDDVLALYGGQSIPAADQEAPEEAAHRALFTSVEGASEAAFRASCSLYLLERLALKLAPFPLQMQVVIATDDAGAATLDALPGPGLWLTVADELLQDRLLLDSTLSSHYHYLAGFSQPYAALLEKQYQQLSQVHV